MPSTVIDVRSFAQDIVNSLASQPGRKRVNVVYPILRTLFDLARAEGELSALNEVARKMCRTCDDPENYAPAERMGGRWIHPDGKDGPGKLPMPCTAHNVQALISKMLE